jgi:hypothetical protein
MDGMERESAPSAIQLSVGGMLLLVACLAINIWLFRLGILWGIIGLNVTKHVVIAYLCQVIGVDKTVRSNTRTVLGPAPTPSFRVRRT